MSSASHNHLVPTPARTRGHKLRIPLTSRVVVPRRESREDGSGDIRERWRTPSTRILSDLAAQRHAAELDHVLVAVTDLAAAARTIEAEYGLMAEEGGRHPGWGTANRIVPLGD